MHDNARPHVARVTEGFLAEHDIAPIRQPPYSPDFNMLDRFIFRNMEASRKDLIFHTRNEARQFVNDYLSTFNRPTLTKQLATYRAVLENIVAIQGDYLPTI